MTGRSSRLADPGFGWRFLLPLCIGVSLNPINSTMIATALATIGRELKVGANDTIWLVSVMYVFSSIGQPIAGRLADRYGPRRVLLAGAVMVLVTGVGGIFAVNMGQLIALRALVGIGTGAIYPAAMAIVRERARRLELPTPTRVLALMGTASLTTLTIGPPLAGALVEYVSWRTIFVVNLPLALISLAMIIIWVDKDAPREPGGGLRGLDLPGMSLFAGSLGSLLIFLMTLSTPKWWVLGLSLAFFAAMVALERRTALPFIDVRVIGGNVPLMLTLLRFVLVFTIVYGVMFGLSQWLEDARGLSPSGVGVVLLIQSGIGALLALYAGRIRSIGGPVIIGVCAMLVGSVLIFLATSQSPLWYLGVIAVVFAIPSGPTFVANQMAVYEQTPAEHIGSVSGLSRTCQFLGALTSAGLIALFFGTHPTDAGLHDLAIVMFGCAIALIVITVVDRSIWGRAKRPPLAAPASRDRQG